MKFTIEKEKNNQVSFLDVSVIRDKSNNKYDTTIYKIPTNTNLYLLFKSNQCRKYKLSLIRSLAIHILLIYSSEKYSHTELQQLRHMLHNNGYPNHMINRRISE